MLKDVWKGKQNALTENLSRGMEIGGHSQI